MRDFARPTPPEIILCRHSVTALNVGEERIRGWQDVPLDAEGIEASKGLAQDIAEHDKAEGPITTVFTSDLTRVLQTAQHVEEVIPHQVYTVKQMELRPWNVGQLTGMPVKDIKAELIRLLKAKTEPAPGGESYAQFATRFIEDFVKIAEYARKLGRPVVVLTHSRNCRVVRALVDGGIAAVLHATASKVLLQDEDPIEPAGHAVLLWSGQKWEWTPSTDRLHTPDTSWREGKSKLRSEEPHIS